MRRVAAILCAAAAFPACGGWVTGGVREPVRAPEWRVGGCLAGDGYVRWTVDGVRVVCAVARSPLVAWYACDDNAASRIALDSSGYGGDGLSSSNSCDRTAAGILGGALLSLTGERTLIASNAQVNAAFASGTWSVALWVKNYGTSHVNALMLYDGVGFGYDGVGALTLWSNWNRDQTVYSLNGTGIACPAVNGMWMHFVVTYDGAVIRVYHDGTLIGTAAGYPELNTTRVVSFGDLCISPMWGAYNDDVRIYNRTLSAGEIADLYASYPSQLPEPVAWFTCDDSAASRVILDSAANAEHGEMTDADTADRALEGVVGGALRFACGDYVGEHVSVTGAAVRAAFSSDAWTFSFWAKRDGPEHMQLVTWRDYSGTEVGGIYWNKDVIQVVGAVPGSAVWIGEPCPLPGSGNAWSHFCFVRSGASWFVHVNGLLLQEYSANSTPAVALLDFGNGSYPAAGNAYKDDVRVYDVALSAAEVAYLYAGYPEPPAPPPVVVTFDPNGGTFPEGASTSKDVTVGDYYYDLPTPENGGSYFAGWYTDSWEYVDYWTTVTRSTSHTLYAMWY